MKSLLRMPLHWQIVCSLVLGAIAGGLVNLLWTQETWAALGVGDPAAWVKHVDADANAGATFLAAAARFCAELMDFAGRLFLRCLRFISVPIVLFSLIAAIAGLGDPRKLGRIGGKTIGIFLFTGFTSAILGVALTMAVGPGRLVTDADRANLPQDAAAAVKASAGAGDYSVWKVILDAIPENPFNALANAQMLQVVVASIIIGLGLTLIAPERLKPILEILEGLADAALKLVQLLMRAAPIAVFALIVNIVGGLGFGVFRALAVYCLVVVLGLAIILFILYPTLTTLLTPSSNKVSWRRFFRALAPAQLFAFSSSSSAATLPVTMACCRERLGASSDITSFVCSLGVSFNMDGTALYQAVVVTFLAQLYGIEMSFIDGLTVALMAAALSIGIPGIPGGSLVIMAVVMEAIGVPAEGIAVILATDRILDMCRTVINVSGDAMGTAIVAASEGKLMTEEEVEAMRAREGVERAAG